jgi:diaminopimelate epimerase
MVIPFYKYHGTGNDFILVDNRHLAHIAFDASLIQRLCRRKFGIGADGLISIHNHPTYDFEMVYYNADGSQSLCGNGSRCAVHLAHYLGMISSQTKFFTTDGSHHAFIEDDLVWLQLKDVNTIQHISTDYWVDTGSPHYVRIVDNLADIDVYTLGKAIRNQEPFQKAGTNVNFVQLGDNNTISVQTYERGVEAVTLSCGTGATAAALVAATKGFKSPIQVTTPGGKLVVRFSEVASSFKDIYLIGPAVMVFQGTIDI